MASPFNEFQYLLQAIQAQCGIIDTYHEGGGTTGRPWMLPPSRGWDGDPFNIGDMAKPFARAEPNQEYIQELNKKTGGKTSICMGRKVEIDYMGMMERAFRARNAGPIRCTMHAAGRRKAHGDPKGIHIGTVLQWVQDLLKAGDKPA